MKIIITGGTGLIGNHLTDRLAFEGHQIVILSRSAQSRPLSDNANVKTVQWDAVTGHGWDHELEGTDAIINLAGANINDRRWTASRKKVLCDSRLNAGKAILHAVESSGFAPGRLIQASGITYYGSRPEGTVIEEDSHGDDFLARLTVEWEASTAPLEGKGVSRAVIRTAPVLETSSGALPPMVMPFLIFAGGRLGSGKQGFSWIHIQDQVDAICFLLDHHEVTGPVNMCAPEPVSYGELATTLGGVLNRPALIPVPGFAMRILLGEVTNHFVNGQYALPRKLTDAGYEFAFPTLETALHNLLQDNQHSRFKLFTTGARTAVGMMLPWTPSRRHMGSS